MQIKSKGRGEGRREEFSVRTPSKLRGEVTLDCLTVTLLSRGTFPVWNETAVSQGFVGKATEIMDRGQTTGLRQFGTPYKIVGESPSHISLLSLAQSCPAIYFESNDLGLNPQLARVAVEFVRNHNTKMVTMSVVIHPTPSDVLDKVLAHFLFGPRCIELVQPLEFMLGSGFNMTYPESANYIDCRVPLSYHLQQSYGLCSTEEVPFQ
jgi:hypothetical protein